jgi:hypothetical protein
MVNATCEFGSTLETVAVIGLDVIVPVMTAGLVTVAEIGVEPTDAVTVVSDTVAVIGDSVSAAVMVVSVTAAVIVVSVIVAVTVMDKVLL